MRSSKRLIALALSTLHSNMERTGDPMGFKTCYWSGWADGLHLPKSGKTLLLTGRMYQMLPYVVQATSLVMAARPFLALRGVGGLLALGNRLAGPLVLGLRGRGEKTLAEKGEKSLKGILAGLRGAGFSPAYLYEDEPYSGVLLHDLGLEGKIESHVGKVYRLLKDRGVERVITVDPHTTHMLREVYPTYVRGFDIEVKHYLELLWERADELHVRARPDFPESFVLHDPCVMARDLGMVEEARKVARKLGIQILESESAGLDTACCGGPVEYAFPDLSEQISLIRAKELARVSKQVLVLCPICLMNLRKHERDLGIRVWDLGEALYARVGTSS
jgi:Fe-S oxidoreductase